MTRAAASVALLRRGRQLEACTRTWNVIGIAWTAATAIPMFTLA